MRSSGGGACPVMHDQQKDDQSEYVCASEVYAFNRCQTKLVPENIKQHCEEEANALRVCDIARRKRDKQTKLYQECVKAGGDVLDCLKRKD